MPTNYIERADAILTQSLGRRWPSRVFDPTIIVTLITSIISVIAKCKEARGGATTAEAVTEIRKMHPVKQRRVIRRQLIKDHGGVKEYRAAGGKDLVLTAIESLNDTEDAVIIGMVDEADDAEELYTL